MCSDSLKKWCESLAHDLKDLHVPDLSVCDRLIATDFLSEDDWEILHKTKRGKSKIKRLIQILSKREDPKLAFTALAKCIALHHEHLSDTVQAALDRFPVADINCNTYRVGAEHNEGISPHTDEPIIRYSQKEPVQHDETAVLPYSLCNVDDISSKRLPSESVEIEINGRLKEENNNFARPTSSVKTNKDIFIIDNGGIVQTELKENNNFKLAQLSGTVEHCVYDEKCVLSDLNENQDNDFRIRNEKENNNNTNITPDNGSIEKIYKGVGIQCTDQDSLFPKITCENELEITNTSYSTSDTYRWIDNKPLPSFCNTHDSGSIKSIDFVDSDMGFTNLYEPGQLDCHPADNVTATYGCGNSNDVLDQFCESPDTRNCIECNNDSHDNTPETIHKNGKSQRTQRLKSKRLKHLSYHQHDTSDSEDLNSVLKQRKNGLDKNSIDKGFCSPAPCLNEQKCLKRDDAFSDVLEKTAPKLQETYAGIKSQPYIARRHKQCIKKIPGQPYSFTQGSSDNNDFVLRAPCHSEHLTNDKSRAQLRDKINFTPPPRALSQIDYMPSPPRALSQIDYMPSFVVHNCVNRAKSWAGPRTRSHIYDGFSSCSEDYTTTDLNYSDLSEMERELCDNLEHSSSITDIVDRLIQEDYLSNDDWCAINEIKVKKNQATYVAKRISNIIRQEGSQSFSNMLKNQPKLSQWLASKFNEPVEHVHFTENRLGEESKHEEQNDFRSVDKDKYTCKSVDEIDGARMVPYCSYNEMRESSAVAIGGRDKRFDEHITRPETLCSPGITVDKHFQDVFDTLNTAFNKGTLPVTYLPSDPNVKCIVLYLKACDALYKTQTEDAERYIELAEAAVNDTDSPMFMTGEIFTQKTWLCLRTNRLGMMERLLEEHEQFLLANPNIWSHKAAGWFYFDYGRFYVRMMSVTKPSRCQLHKKSRAFSKTAYDVYKDKAMRCLRKSVDYFAHSDSSDGPIGMGFSISLLACVELDCVTEYGYLKRGVIENNVPEAEKLLQTVASLYDEIPDVLKTSYLLSKSDLCFRKNEIDYAKELVNECVDLSDKLCLQEELKECKKRLRLLKHFS